jgi:type 1 glutamine amidotransferase/sugar phosphate isomerase/epimerase
LALALLAGWVVGPASAQQAAWTVIGWRVGVLASSFPQATFFEAVDKTAAAGAKSIEGDAGQKVSAEISKNFDWNLADTEIAAVRQKLRSAGVTMPAYYTHDIPDGEEAARKLFQFAKSLAVETIVSDPAAGQLAAIDKLAGEYGINVALVDRDAKTAMQALEGRSKRMGVCPDISAWMAANLKPMDGLKLVKDRLISLHLADSSQLGSSGRAVPLGTGVAGLEEFLREVNRLGIKPTELTVAGAPAEIAQSVAYMDKMVIVALGDTMDQTSKTTATRWNATPESRQKIEAAVPKTAPAQPKKPRKLLVVDLQAAYGGHGSLPNSNVAIQAMGKQTGAYEPIFNNDLANLRYDKLRQYDALFLNNTVGPILNAQEVREGLLRYVREGGGLIGYHGTGRASLDWPEFGEMLGSYSGPHTVSNEKVTIKVDDPKSPLVQGIDPNPFPWTDEFFRFPTPPYSREKLHILLTMTPDIPQNCAGCSRPDGDYAVSWIRNYGQGRVFYSVLGHTASDFWEPWILRHFLAGIQFALGDLAADATPSGVKE